MSAARAHDRLAGALRLRPGDARRPLDGGRSRAALRLFDGWPADRAPQLAERVFALCAHAQGLAARAAVAAARGAPPADDAQTALELRAAVAREHLLHATLQGRRVVLPGRCPLFMTGLDAAGALAAMPAWLAAEEPGLDGAAWLAAFEREGVPFADAWVQRSQSALLGDWRALRADARSVAAVGRPLQPVFDDAAPGRAPPAWTALGLRLLEDDAFAAAPEWLGAPAETGAWTRAAFAAQSVDNAWMRLLHRWADLLRVCVGTPPSRGAAGAGASRPVLAWGAATIAAHTGMAWVETARGLLVHAVRLDAAGQRVERLRTLAPTDWNAHPRGALAQALAALCGERVLERTEALRRAFDPCVACVVEPAPREEARAHA